MMAHSQVCAIVIFFKPNSDCLINIRLLLDQAARVVIVDNTPEGECSVPSDELQHLDRCDVIRNAANLGIAAALNIGIRHAIAKGFEWIATFDQDSKISDGFFEGMMQTYDQSLHPSKIGMLCPQYVDANLGIVIPMDKNSAGEIVGCWTSGSMMRAEIFKIVGDYDEDLFIDMVDHDYCIRMRCLGYSIVASKNAVLIHSLGKITLRKFLRGISKVTNHSPERRYYINRNRLVMIRRYYRVDREGCLDGLRGLIIDSIIVLKFENKKAKKALFMIKALYDGIMNRLGPRVTL